MEFNPSGSSWLPLFSSTGNPLDMNKTPLPRAIRLACQSSRFLQGSPNKYSEHCSLLQACPRCVTGSYPTNLRPSKYVDPFHPPLWDARVCRYVSTTSLDTAPLDRTGLYDIHLKHGAKMVPFAGYSMPVRYSDLSVGESHKWTREKASLFDVGHMYGNSLLFKTL